MSDARNRMVLGAVDLLARRGIEATSMRELAKHAGTPLGSTYHYFPEGKGQLTREAVERGGDVVAAQLDHALAAGPIAGLRLFLAAWRKILRDNDFDRGCPVLAVAVSGARVGESSDAVAAAAVAFERWQELLRASLREAGLPAGQAAELAALAVCSVEGAVAVCRSSGSVTALDRVGRACVATFEHALAERPAQAAHTEVSTNPDRKDPR